MYAFILVLHVIACLVLIAVILLQAGRGGGLAGGFGEAAAEKMFGTSASRFMTKATSVCAVLFLCTCISLVVLSSRRSRSLLGNVRPTSQPAQSAPSQENAGQ